MEEAEAKVKAMSDANLSLVWEALKDYDASELWGEGVSMDDWAQLVYSEVSRRKIMKAGGY